MVIAKETRTAFFPQPVETPRREQNSFLRFIGENKDLFRDHSSLAHELRDMEEGWRTSPEVGRFVNEAVRLGLSLIQGDNNRQARRTVDKEIEKTRVRVIGTIFNNDAQEHKMYAKQRHSVFAALPHFSAETIVSFRTLNEDVVEFRRAFQEERRSVTGPLRESTMELMGKFREFLLLDPSGIFMFQEFLSSKESGGTREEIRPFLLSLIEEEERMNKDGEGILSSAAKKWTGELKERPTPIIIDEFTASIRSPNIIEWLAFAIRAQINTPHAIEQRDNLIRDIAKFLKSYPDISTWTQDLRRELISFVTSKYLQSLLVIRKDLDRFKVPAKKSIPQWEAEVEKKQRRVNDNTQDSAQQEKQASIVQTKVCPVGVLVRESGQPNYIPQMDEAELEQFLNREGAHLSSSDQKMIEDLKRIVENLRRDPYGVGTKKLSGQFVGVGPRRLPLRSIDPRKRTRLVLGNSESYRTRVVYVIHKDGEEKIVGIEGIYNHHDYDNKFG